MADGTYFEADQLFSGAGAQASTDAKARQRQQWLSDIRGHLSNLDLSSTDCEGILGLLEAAPSRQVGANALDNVVSRFPSQKNPQPLELESQTCEQLFAFELEADESVLWYAAQVPCRGVTRGSHVSNATADFMVGRHRSVTVVETKPEAKLEQLAKKRPQEWVKEGSRWRRPPVEAWATARGLSYQIWTPPEPFGIYLCNMNHLWMTDCDPLPPRREQWLLRRLRCELAKSPRSIDELKELIPTFNEHVASIAMKRRAAFGWIKSALISEASVFHLFLDEAQANETDLRRHSSIALDLKPLDEAHALVSASPRAFACAVRRLHAVQSEHVPRSLMWLKKAVQAAEAEGTDPLVLCMPDYAASGNRERRLDSKQISAIDKEIKYGWLQGRTSSLSEVRHNINRTCSALGARPVSATTVRREVLKTSSAQRALATGGKRAYQAQSESTDPALRTLRPYAVGARLHIDSSKFDMRCAPDLLPRLGFEAPTLYIGVDACSEGAATHSLIFGRARTDGLALLIRRYVQKYGALPREIWVDRGPENRSDWMEEFCDINRIRLLMSPTAGSRWNSLAENAIGRVNHALAHFGPGSTLPDQRGRSVDGAFKSKNTARLMFSKVAEELNHTLYVDMAGQPLASGGTAQARELAALKSFGHVGKRCAFDDWLFIQTAVPVALCAIDPRRGVRLVEGVFVSEALLARARRERPIQMRLDCANPTKLYVRFESGWVCARSTNAQLCASLSDDQKLFELLYGAMLRAESAMARDEQAGERFDRLQAAIAQLPDSVGLAEPVREGVAPEEDDSLELLLDEIPSFDREQY